MSYYITPIEILKRLFYYTFAELLWNTDESFEKRSVLFKAKEGENFNHPREIGFAFHGAVNLWKVKKNFRVCYAQKQLLISISTNLLVEHFYCSFSCSLTNR